MGTTTGRYVIDSHGPSAAGMKLGFAIARLLAERAGRNMVLMVPLKGHVTNGTLDPIIGRSQARVLSKGGWLKAEAGVKVRSESILTIRKSRVEEVVLAIYPDHDGFASIDRLVEAAAVVMLPWLEKERDEWIQRCNPRVIAVERPPS